MNKKYSVEASPNLIKLIDITVWANLRMSDEKIINFLIKKNICLHLRFKIVRNSF